MRVAQACLDNVSPPQVWTIISLTLSAAFMFRSGFMIGYHGFPALMVPIVFTARRVWKMSVIFSLIVQNSEIMLNLRGPI